MSRSEKTMLWVTGLLLVCAIGVNLAAGSVGDKDWLLLATRMWLSGKRLYVDIFEIDPPMILALFSGPVALSMHLGRISDYQALVAMGLGVAAFSIFLTWRLLRRHPQFNADRRAQLFHACLLALVWIAATSPAEIFDREHLFFMMIFPFLLRFLPSLEHAGHGNWLRAMVGALAGVGFCIKPHCALVFAAVQCARLLRERRLSALFALENLIICAIAALYLAAIALFLPDYLTVMMPMALATYAASGQQINGLLFGVMALVLLGVAFADYRWRASSPFRRDIWYLLALCPGFLAYALANNGWAYTYHLLISLILILTGWVFLEYRWFAREAERNGAPGRPLVLGAQACALSLGASIGFSLGLGIVTVITGCADHLRCSRWGRELVDAVKGERSFGALSSSFDVWTRLSRETGARWDTRFTHFWMLPRMISGGEAFARRHRWIPAYVAAAYAEDLDRWKPGVVFVDNSDRLYMTPMHLDLVAYLSGFPRFPEAWSHYRHAGTIRTCAKPEPVHCSFEVYRRRP